VDSGWETFIGIADLAGHPPKFVSFGQESNRLLIRFFRQLSDNTLKGRVWFGPLCEGPPRTAHGGSVAAVLDEAMGQAGWLAKLPVVAAKIEVNFRKMLPLGRIMNLHAEVTRVDGRKVFIAARILGPKNELFADSTGLFIVLSREDQKKMFRKSKLALL
jgi:acyl-coenzyme A thioesterase PaaI-like protein